ncbi:hypothetical protein JYG23_01870 [Sedimentibacter sp. zth1]|uniref:hypothetical protein n=1 Tax=Sedimentibacter sp. zth1 TaxID=2816908 RepID=UPI001A90D25E|nr:hypothetical protein [Sedimentibacter sp. zth1]QSX06233.1 hypothetical protein JYG23_01870 [Sedimentibacter sp. zth1]
MKTGVFLIKHIVSGLYLNVYGDETIEEGRKLCLYSYVPNVKAEQWRIDKGSYRFHLKSELDNRYQISSIKTGLYEDKPTIVEIIENNTLTFVQTDPNNDNVFMLYGNGGWLRPVANHSLADVFWKVVKDDADPNNKWELIDVNSPPPQPEGSKILNLNFRNINQRFDGYYKGSEFNPGGANDPMYQWGCSRCSVACILSNIEGVEIDPRDVPTNLNYEVVFSNISSEGVISTNVTHDVLAVKGSSEQTCLSAIKQSIDNGIPVIVRVVSAGSNHFCIAYGYENGGATRGDIITYDTIWTGNTKYDNNTNKLYGEKANLGRVISLNFGSGSFNEVFTYI